jgi:hypothetical protein
MEETDIRDIIKGGDHCVPHINVHAESCHGTFAALCVDIATC